MQPPPYHGELTVNPYLPSDAAFCRSVLLGSVVYYASSKPAFASLFVLRGVTKTSDRQIIEQLDIII